MKKPNTSVAVVKNIDDDNAGSIFNFANINGISIPHIPDITRFAIIARNTITPRYIFQYIIQTIVPVTSPIIAPLIDPNNTCFPNKCHASFNSTLPIAMFLIIIDTV